MAPKLSTILSESTNKLTEKEERNVTETIHFLRSESDISRSTDGRQLTDSRPTGFLGRSSSQLPAV